MQEAKLTGDVWIFFRGDRFYPVMPTERCRVEDHVELNPGTTKVINAKTKKVIWTLQ